jgi:murein L,D-transpeptidase YcbB/YkuD
MSRATRTTPARLLLLVLLALCAAAAPPADDDAGRAVATLLASGRCEALARPKFGTMAAALTELYAREGDALFWFEQGAPEPALGPTLAALAGIDRHGLAPDDYDAARLAALHASLQVTGLAQLARFDVALSLAALRALRDVRQGRVDPRLIGFDYDVAPKAIDLPRALRAARDGEVPGLETALAASEPPFGAIRRLLHALARYRALAAAGDLAPLPPLPRGRRKVAPGDAWEGLDGVATRLQAFGDLDPREAPALGTRYAEPLVAAVRRFQQRHALERDGVLGAATLAALDVPPSARVRQIELALERARWLPPLGAHPAVFVNVPLFRLWAWDPQRPGATVRMKVVVGKSMGHATPMFSGTLDHVIFRPYWNPPHSIVRRELLPQARSDPGYLAREELEIVDRGDAGAPALPPTPENLSAVARGRLFLRQRPGPKNSLGLAKFIFPNPADVYMHGTPATALFERARRDFSHGCIRVEDPTALAEWALSGTPGWDRARIEKAMAAGPPTRVDVARETGVFVFYDTAYVDPDGRVHFGQDLYGHDARLDAALRER